MSSRDPFVRERKVFQAIQAAMSRILEQYATEDLKQKLILEIRETENKRDIRVILWGIGFLNNVFPEMRLFFSGTPSMFPGETLQISIGSLDNYISEMRSTLIKLDVY